MSFSRDLNAAALWAGLTTFLWFASGMVPLQIAVSAQLGLDPSLSSSGTFVVWFSAAIASIVLSASYRQPLPITWTIPGLLYLGTLGAQFSFPELVGANLVAGCLIVVLGLFGMGEQVMRWLPLPIVMGMFAGSILDYIIRMVKVTVEDFWIAGPTVIGYLAGRAVNRPGVPPMGAAVICGALAIFFLQPSTLLAVSWALPGMVIPEMEFSAQAIVAVSLPLVVLSMVLGNVQGLGFLIAQGYRVPVKSVTVVVGIASVLNALLGGYPAIVGRTAVAILAAPDAGPPSGRYAGTLVAAVLTLLIALAAGPLTSLLALLPRSYVVALAGLAIFSSLLEACEKAFGGKLKFGALVAFAVAATPFAFAGINSAFWALIVGFAVSLLVERRELLAARHENRTRLDSQERA